MAWKHLRVRLAFLFLICRADEKLIFAHVILLRLSSLIAPGVEMADILAFNLCQVSSDIGTFKPRKMNNPDLSTKLKLMGVDVASLFVPSLTLVLRSSTPS
jgi:hypothetical protein